MNFIESSQTDWAKFKALLRRTFLPTYHDYRLRIQMTELSQNNDSVDAYNRKFLAFSPQLTGLTVADRLFYYTSGLHDGTRYEVLSKQHKSLDVAMPVATQF
jgi:hypothetical protein